MYISYTKQFVSVNKTFIRSVKGTLSRSEKLSFVDPFWHVFRQYVIVVKRVHVDFGYIQNCCPDKYGFVEQDCCFGHADEGQILVYYSELLEVWFGYVSFRLLFVCRKNHLTSVAQILDRFSIYLNNKRWSF